MTNAPHAMKVVPKANGKIISILSDHDVHASAKVYQYAIADYERRIENLESVDMTDNMELSNLLDELIAESEFIWDCYIAGFNLFVYETATRDYHTPKARLTSKEIARCACMELTIRASNWMKGYHENGYTCYLEQSRMYDVAEDDLVEYFRIGD